MFNLNIINLIMNLGRIQHRIWQISLTLMVMLMVYATFGCDGTRFIFSSSKDLMSTPDDLGLDYEEVWLDTRDGVQLHGWFVPGRPGMPLALFFHGNAANISHRVDILQYFNEIGLATFIFDYRGFGRSRGQSIREEDLYMDARGALDYLRTRGWSSSRIIYYGRSMGAAVSLQLGLETPPAAVVLECPFTSMSEIAWHTAPITYGLIGWWTIDAKFDNINKIEKLSRPVIIFQGDQDKVVPQNMAERLFQRANEPKALYLIPGGGHSNLFQVGGEKYRNAWIDLIRQWVPSEKPG
jgi:alpha-beta hydrolase superfamily lysophospholipase